MTITKAPQTNVVKVRAVSSRATDLIRARTQLQQREGRIVVGRTFFRFNGSPAELDSLLDYLIMNEIPGAGASSKEVRRLREIRRWVRAASIDPLPNDEDAAHVEIVTGVDRDHVLDLIDRIWQAATGTEAADELSDLADASNPNVTVDYRAWLASVL